MPLTIAYASDIHLEFRDKGFENILKGKADVLCLCGDITPGGIMADFTKFQNFLSYIKDRYKQILHIAGNHEYYSFNSRNIDKCLTMKEIDKRFKSLSAIIPNYKYLNCDTVNIKKNNKNYVFIGCTLWTYVSPQNRVKVESIMNDYNAILYKKKGKIVKFEIEEMQRLHKKHVTYIKKSLAENKDNNVILMVHHKPFVENKTDKPSDECYHTDLHSKIKKYSNIKCIIYGHTHVPCKKIYENILYLSNPKGYPSQKTKFIDNLSITIK